MELLRRCLLTAVLATPALPTGGDPLPVELRVHAGRIEADGRLHLRLEAVPEERLEQPYALRITLDVGGDEDLVFDQELKPAPQRWPVGERTEFEATVTVPQDVPLERGDAVLVFCGFYDPASRAIHPPTGDGIDAEGSLSVASVPLPGFFGTRGKERLEAVFAEAARLRREGDAPAAWSTLEAGLREAPDDLTKDRFRKALLEVGKFDPAPVSALEETVVAQRIRAEKVRYFRLIAGRLYDRGMLQGALRLLEEAGGSLAESADEAVLGALDEAERVTRNIEDIHERLCHEPTGDVIARAQALVDEHDLTRELFDLAEELAQGGDYPVALELMRRLRKSDFRDVEDDARARVPELCEAYAALTPPEQEAEVRKAVEHPAWERTTTVASHCFLYIGPRNLVEGIPDPSKLNFDLAYVFITDLFGRVPNPEGDRVTVYFKELWDFGGGVGGGKIIDIGNARPEPRRPVRVDTGLLYHELTHCVDDTRPVFRGFVEGLANVGAAYAYEALDQSADALHSFDRNLEAFRKYFLDRDLEYWRIQNYGPSAGFFLHFVEEYATLGKGRHDWSPLRQFFREYRAAPVHDGRETFIVRGLAHYLMRGFGPQVFDDLVRFGFPLEDADRPTLMRELLAFEDDDLEDFEGGHAAFPNSPLPRDLLERDLSTASRRGPEATKDLREDLGILFDWKVIGPFFTRNADPGGCVFEPEVDIDLKRRVEALRSTKDGQTQLVWRDPIGTWDLRPGNKPVTLDPTGWLRMDYEPYGQRNAAIYALTNVTVEEDTDAVAHLRADDDFILFVNDERMQSYRARGTNHSSSYVRWRGPFQMLPDALQVPVRLKAGRNKVLVKIRNHGGPAGLSMALSRPDGTRFPFEADVEQPDPPAANEPAGWRRVARLDHRSFKGKTKTTVGSFKSKNKLLYGGSTAKGVAWRMFTVRPGFPKDSPSNLAWFKPNLTEDLDEGFRLTFELSNENGSAPKFGVTFQGDGEEDGLSGWTLILVPHGSAVSARLERYDRLVYHTERLALPEGVEPRVLVLTYADRRLTVTLDEVAVFEGVWIDPVRDRNRIGLMTWGPEPRLHSLELERLKSR